MARPLVPDELWDVVQPLLPRHRARPGKRGRPPVDDRACLTGIVFVLQSGIPWEMLPQEMGCGSGMTCWRRLRYWQRRGVWKKLLHALLQRVGQAQGIAETGDEDGIAAAVRRLLDHPPDPVPLGGLAEYNRENVAGRIDLPQPVPLLRGRRRMRRKDR